MSLYFFFFFFFCFCFLPFFARHVQIQFQYSTICNTSALFSSSNISCQSDPLFFNVLHLNSTLLNTSTLACNAMCKVIFNAKSPTAQTLVINYYRNGTYAALGKAAIISITNAWTVMSYSFSNPGGSFYLSISNSNPAIISDILVSSIFTTDEYGLSLNDINLLYQPSYLVTSAKFLQSPNSYDLVSELLQNPNDYNSASEFVNLTIVGQFQANDVRTCNNLAIIGGNDQMKLVGKTTANSFNLTIANFTEPHFTLRISIDLYVLDNWSGEDMVKQINISWFLKQ